MSSFEDMSKVSPNNVLKARTMLDAANMGMVHLIHLKMKDGKEVDVIGIMQDMGNGLGLQMSNIFPIAVMIDDLDQFELPPGVIKVDSEQDPTNN